MDMQTKISVVLSVFNSGKTIKKCMDSLLGQTISKDKYEIIIVDDASEDYTVNIAAEYKKNFDNIKIVAKKKNEGTLLSRIDGIKKSCGKYITFIDSDDWVEENLLEEVIREFEQSDVDIVEYGHYAEYKNNFHEVYGLDEGTYQTKYIIKKFSHRKINSFVWLRSYSSDIVKNAIEYITNNIEFKDLQKINTDDEFLFPIIINIANKYRVIHKPLYHYKVDSEGSTTDNIIKNDDKKLIHINLLLKSGDLILKSVLGKKSILNLYLYMQINNYFYYLGEMVKKSNIAKRKEYFISFDNFILRYKCYIIKSYSLNVIIRFMHLLFKSWYIKRLTSTE